MPCCGSNAHVPRVTTPKTELRPGTLLAHPWRMQRLSSCLCAALVALAASACDDTADAMRDEAKPRAQEAQSEAARDAKGAKRELEEAAGEVKRAVENVADEAARKVDEVDKSVAREIRKE